MTDRSTAPYDYSDLVHRERPISKKHRPMSMENRAAQFSPFAALTGYEESIRETARLTDRKTELTESRKAELDQRLSEIDFRSGPELQITCFRKDPHKEGGRYVTISGKVRKLDTISRCIIMEGGEVISIDDIYDL